MNCLFIDGERCLDTCFQYLETPHSVCRPEIYKVKATCYHAMKHYTSLITTLRDSVDLCKEPSSPSLSGPKSLPASSSKKTRSRNTKEPPANLVAPMTDLKKLMDLFDKILREEYPGSDWESKESTLAHALPLCIETSESSYNLSCDFCGSDIFLSGFECKSPDTCTSLNPLRVDPDCGTSSSDACILCPGCYVEGRTCPCGLMQPIFYRSYQVLVEERNKAARVVNSIVTGATIRPFEISPKCVPSHL